uniref:Uncharacterized protein n=1 Tax=Cucumis sativus TaxID=3659 RepID=A0A0A0LYF0_CUCSA
MADSSSFNMKKRGAASEGVELVEENGLKRRSCSSSPLPTGSGHDTTQAGALIEQLRWNFMTDKLRELEYEIEKRISHSINSPSCGDETEGREREREVLRDGLIKEKLPEWENEFRETVMKELDRIAQLQLKPPPPNPLSYQYERGSGSGTWKLRLHFCNQIASIMYPKDEIKGIDDNPLRLEIRDAYYNTIIDTGLLSSAPFQIFLFEEENDSKRSPDFVPADKLRELMSFKAIQICTYLFTA